MNRSLVPVTPLVAAAVPSINPLVIAMIISLAPFMEVLDTTIVNVALQHIAGSLSVSPHESTWVLTAYLVANGIIVPLSGWLSGAFGRKKYFMLSIGVFTLASFLCGAASSLLALVFFRLVQGMAGGGLLPMQQSIMLDTFPPEKRAMAFALTGVTVVAAPVLGPTLGGLITDSYSWRWVFWINIPIGILAIFLVSRFIHDSPHSESKGFQKLDGIGLILIVLGLGCLQIILDKGQEEDWFQSSFITSMALISFSSLSIAVWWLLRQAKPIIDLHLLKNRSYAIACFLIFFAGFSIYGGVVLMPLLMESNLGYTATLAGFVLSPGAIGIMLLMPVSARLSERIPPRFLVCFGLILTAAGMAYSAIIPPDIDFKMLVAIRFGQVLGLPFLFIPISALAFKDIPKEKNDKASAFFSLSRNLGGSVGISVAVSYFLNQQQIHTNFLVSKISSQQPAYQETMSQLHSYLGTQGIVGQQATIASQGWIYNQLSQQASFLAYADSFMLISFFAVLALGIALLLPTTPIKTGEANNSIH